MLARRGDTRGALRVLERKGAVSRVLTVRAASPLFHDRADAEAYRRALALTASFSALAAERSRLLEGGAPSPADSARLEKAISDNENELAKLAEGLERAGSAIAPFLRPPAGAVSELRAGVTFRFLIVDGSVHGWRTGGKNVEHRNLGNTGTEGRAALAEGVRRFIAESANETLPRFVTFDEHSAALVGMLGPSGFPPFMFTTAAVDARGPLARASADMTSLYADDPSLARRLKALPTLARLVVRGGDIEGVELARYSVLVASAGSGERLSPSSLFANRLDAEVLILNMQRYDEERIALAASRALCGRPITRRVSRARLQRDGRSGRTGSRCRTRSDKSGGVRDHRFPLAFGMAGTAIGVPPAGERPGDALYAGFIEKLRGGDAATARIYLDRWSDAVRGDANAAALYALHSAELALLWDNPDEASTAVDRVLAGGEGVSREVFKKAEALKAYLLLYRGMIDDAAVIIARNREAGAVEYNALAFAYGIARVPLMTRKFR